jgi:hypothetical protein
VWARKTIEIVLVYVDIYEHVYWFSSTHVCVVGLQAIEIEHPEAVRRFLDLARDHLSGGRNPLSPIL